ncbi:MAG: FKBP-type peptidyl-prolyl cis-trans isomerase [Alistipes sp.]|nr:FKBP-type peptidyl-prolyl cis-trans isomerase [Alistipes sp.]
MKKIFATVLAFACAAAVISCSNSKGTVIEGNASQMDSLSYCLGANVGYGVKGDMGDIPFDIELVKKGITDGALDKAKQSHDEAVELLRDYFMNQLRERREALDAQKADSTFTGEYINLFATEEEKESVSYAFGNDIGHNIRASKLPLQTYWLTKGFGDAQEGSTEVTMEDVQKFLQHYFMVVRPAQAAERSAAWLEKIEKKSGVQKTESGLLYKVVKAGDMEKAAKDDRDRVKVHYVGRLQDGTVFDASKFENRSKEQQEQLRKYRPEMFDEKGKLVEPEDGVEFPLDRVIKGWTEGMKLVGPGGKILLYIPAELAYGQRGAGRDIGPNEALEFEVELLSVDPYTQPETPAEPEGTEAAQ